MSIGYNKELLVAMFASSLIKVSDHEDVTSDPDLVQKANKDHRLNKRINRRLASLKKDIDDHIYNAITPEMAKWFKKNTDKRVAKALGIIDENLVSLELLAVWILFSNFAEMNERVDESLEFLKKYDYIALVDLMMETEAKVVEGEMFNISNDIILRLKG